jgi:type II secretory pathway pseudopilin PulG
MNLRRRSRSGSFTIAELLIAMGITALIVVMLGAMFGSLINTSSRANQRIDAFREARAALQMMERDLTGLVRAPQTAYFALDKRWQDTGNDSYSDPSNGNPNRQLFALVSAKNQPAGKTTNEIGDVCAVGYYCKWEGDTKTGYRYTLRRLFRHSIDTYNLIKPQIGGGTLNYTSAGALYSPAATDDVLASYIWNLQIMAYKADGTVDNTYPLIISDPASPAATLPAAVEISFYAISPQAARTVMSVTANPDDWMKPSSPNYVRLIAPHTYEFRTRIKL